MTAARGDDRSLPRVDGPETRVRLSSESLFGREREIVIVHRGQEYRLRITRADKLILTKPFPLHNGEAFGLAGRMIVFVAGLAPALLAVTGTLIWWRKRRGRARAIGGRQGARS